MRGLVFALTLVAGFPAWAQEPCTPVSTDPNCIYTVLRNRMFEKIKQRQEKFDAIREYEAAHAGEAEKLAAEQAAKAAAAKAALGAVGQ